MRTSTALSTGVEKVVNLAPCTWPNHTLDLFRQYNIESVPRESVTSQTRERLLEGMSPGRLKSASKNNTTPLAALTTPRALSAAGGKLGSIPGWATARISPSGNRAGRYRWSAGFLADLPSTPPFHSNAAPFSPRFTLIGSQCVVVKSRTNLSITQNLFQEMNNPEDTDGEVVMAMAVSPPILPFLAIEAAPLPPQFRDVMSVPASCGEACPAGRSLTVRAARKWKLAGISTSQRGPRVGDAELIRESKRYFVRATLRKCRCACNIFTALVSEKDEGMSTAECQELQQRWALRKGMWPVTVLLHTLRDASEDTKYLHTGQRNRMALEQSGISVDGNSCGPMPEVHNSTRNREFERFLPPIRVAGDSLRRNVSTQVESFIPPRRVAGNPPPQLPPPPLPASEVPKLLPSQGIFSPRPVRGLSLSRARSANPLPEHKHSPRLCLLAASGTLGTAGVGVVIKALADQQQAGGCLRRRRSQSNHPGTFGSLLMNYPSKRNSCGSSGRVQSQPFRRKNFPVVFEAAVVIVPGDAAGRRVFSEISRLPSPSVPMLLHTDLASSSSSQNLAIKSRPNVFTQRAVGFCLDLFLSLCRRIVKRPLAELRHMLRVTWEPLTSELQGFILHSHPGRGDLSHCLSVTDLIRTAHRFDGNTARLARRSDEALGMRVSVARITPSLVELERSAT
ncbi:hypothetical protein PR048_006784 [Dryococelus australis]|uniref:Uncharacterized protein n=1 Tax=Dryococelus australis TaxID=614101 RepID=A0ABQ9ID51_9NEOP|nr:hypothetical protein PR048_006784 [Dryococelus australis]